MSITYMYKSGKLILIGRDIELQMAVCFLAMQQVLRSLAPRTFHAGVIITCAT